MNRRTGACKAAHAVHHTCVFSLAALCRPWPDALQAAGRLPHCKAAHRCCPSHVPVADRGQTRFKQLVDWCGQDFDGLIIFDESELLARLSATRCWHGRMMGVARSLFVAGPKGTSGLVPTLADAAFDPCLCTPNVQATKPRTWCPRGAPAPPRYDACVALAGCQQHPRPRSWLAVEITALWHPSTRS